MLLHNHGLMTCGGSIADTFLMMFIFQRACEIQVMAQAGGSELIAIPEQILAGAKAMAAGVTRTRSGMGGALAWPAGCASWMCKAPVTTPEAQAPQAVLANR